MAVIWFFGASLLSVLAIFSRNATFLLIACLYFVVGIIYVFAYRKAKKLEENEKSKK